VPLGFTVEALTELTHLIGYEFRRSSGNVVLRSRLRLVQRFEMIRLWGNSAHTLSAHFFQIQLNRNAGRNRYADVIRMNDRRFQTYLDEKQRSVQHRADAA
jgi:hypothetical protein